jgi:hypothetical protein
MCVLATSRLQPDVAVSTSCSCAYTQEERTAEVVLDLSAEHDTGALRRETSDAVLELVLEERLELVRGRSQQRR